MMPVLTFVAVTSTPGMTALAASPTVPPTVALLWAYTSTEKHKTNAKRRMCFCPIPLSSVGSSFFVVQLVLCRLIHPGVWDCKKQQLGRSSDLQFVERGLFLVLIR